MSLRAGRLRHRVTIETPVRASDGAGGARQEWAPVGDAWAAVEPVAARTLDEAGGERMATTHRVIIRHRPGVTIAQRIRFGARILRIDSVSNHDEVGEYLDLRCEEVVGR